MSQTNRDDNEQYENYQQPNPNNNQLPNNIRLDASSIAQGLVISILIGLTTTVLQLRQDVAIIRDQMQNVILAKEFASFKAITEEHDIQYNKRLDQIEKRLDNK
jgi:hypothetical protein